jgi:hypothetical protein
MVSEKMCAHPGCFARPGNLDADGLCERHRIKVARAATSPWTYDERDAFTDEMLKTCVPKSGPHVQRPMPDGWTQRLYTVTTKARNEKYGGTRTVCVCDSFERARQIIETNEGDIEERSYHFAIIEAVCPNVLYAYSGEAYWYLWREYDFVNQGGYGQFEPIEPPPWMANIVGFGIG